MLKQEIQEYIDAHEEEAYRLLVTLAQIPAPSNHEEKRVEFAGNGWKIWEQRAFTPTRR